MIHALRIQRIAIDEHHNTCSISSLVTCCCGSSIWALKVLCTAASHWRFKPSCTRGPCGILMSSDWCNSLTVGSIWVYLLQDGRFFHYALCSWIEVLLPFSCFALNKTSGREVWEFFSYPRDLILKYNRAFWDGISSKSYILNVCMSGGAKVNVYPCLNRPIFMLEYCECDPSSSLSLLPLCLACIQRTQSASTAYLSWRMHCLVLLYAKVAKFVGLSKTHQRGMDDLYIGFRGFFLTFNEAGILINQKNSERQICYLCHPRGICSRRIITVYPCSWDCNSAEVHSSTLPINQLVNSRKASLIQQWTN